MRNMVLWMALMAVACGLAALQADASAAADRANRARQPKYDQFVLGVFIDSSKERLSVPLTKVFTDFLMRGIELVCIGQYNYFPLAREKNLNTFAKANGVRLICNMFFEHLLPDPLGTYSDDELRAIIKAQVDAVNALPDSDAVIAWRTGDESEAGFWGEKDRKERLEVVARNFRRFSDLIREIDPTRLVTVNHCYIPGDTWLDLGEDLPMSSTGMTGIYNSYRVREQIASAQRLGFDNYFLVAQACPSPLGVGNLRWYGYREPISDAVIQSRAPAQHVQDYAEVAYTEGAAGIIYFLYWAGGDNYTEYTLVDSNGDDYLGKWEAVRKAAENIRKWEGAPWCSITRPIDRTWVTVPFTVTVEATAPEGESVAVVKADYSLDGAMSWWPLPDAVAPPYTFTISTEEVKELPSTVWIRTRALNERGASLWDVVEVRCSN